MKVVFNVKKIRKFMNHFYNCTKVPVTLFDSSLNCVYACGEPQRFCNNFYSDPELMKQCELSNHKHTLQAKNEKKTIIYTCHAGIVEVVSPIFHEEFIIAYIMLGRFRDKEQIYSSAKKVSKAIEKYPLNHSVMLMEYKQLPIVSHAEIDSFIYILEMCIGYIWRENLIDLNKNLFADQLETYIDANLDKELTVASLCKTFGVSKQNLYDIFKNEFNTTVKNYIIHKRVQRATQLLHKDKKVYEIAEMVGFNDYNYFIKAFKKVTGTTPYQYRKTNK